MQRFFARPGFRGFLLPLALFVLATPWTAGQASGKERNVRVVDLRRSKAARIVPVPLSDVRITGGLWARRRETNAARSIPSLYEQLESHGIVDNFRRLSGRKSVGRRGPLYTDSDLYKWIEGAAFALEASPDAKLREMADGAIREIVAAQEPSGYLNTMFAGERAKDRWQNQGGNHELYCLGHMLQAGIAYARVTGDRKLLDAGIRFVNHLIRDVEPSGQALYSGHPEIEMALIELYREEGDKRYLDLAGRILHGAREQLKISENMLRYTFSGKPFTERTVMEGHAVRACYASAGATDYFLETGDPAYWKTLTALWEDMSRRKMYVTGGVGSRAEGEAFGAPFELPNARAYTESCAAIANLMWSWRMLQADPEVRYADVIERALYNSINSGMSLSGTLYCYRNPLELAGDPNDKIRNPWYDTTCCPPNLERMFASLPGYYYSASGDGLYIHLYGANDLATEMPNGTRVGLKMETAFPWDGKVRMTLSLPRPSRFTLFPRIPEWSVKTALRVNGRSQNAPPAGRYVALEREWKNGDVVELALDMTPRVLHANPLARENYGTVAVQRGPIVYALEQPDQPLGVPVRDAALALTGDAAKDFQAEWRPGLLGGVTVLRHRGIVYETPSEELPLYGPSSSYANRKKKAAELTLIPYYTFHNRGEAALQVWLPYEERSTSKASTAAVSRP